MLYDAPIDDDPRRHYTAACEEKEAIKVLIVDDSLTIRSELRKHLDRLEKVTVLETSTLAETRALLDGQRHSLFCAILDLTLADASRGEIVDLVRSYGVPVIVLTASMSQEIRRAVLETRVIDYMFKNGKNAIKEVAYLVEQLRQNQTMKVMIVDDSITFRQHLAGMLAQYRYPILLATNGREALTLLEQHPETALVLTDYHMPEMDGLGLVRGIRRRYRREELAIIALSQAHEKELSATLLKAGANDFLNKDFQTEELYCRVVQNTNMVRFVRQLRDLINLDYLTRLYNRRYLFQVAKLLHAESSVRPGVLALAMVDADYFKRINDGFGHSAGDEALKHIATLLRRAFPRTDIIARYGGEEFVCVVTVDRPEDAWYRFDKLREKIANTPLSFEGATIRMTVSIGLTTVLGSSLAEMIACADRAVYRAKAEGRNRVVLEP